MAASVRSCQEDSAPALDPQTSDSYAKVTESRGKGQFLVTLPSGSTHLIHMPAKFRNTLWIRRGSFVIARPESGELVHVLTTEQVKEIKREGKWPVEFNTPIFEEESSESSVDSSSEESSEYYESES